MSAPHPHELQAQVPDRLDPAIVRSLSRIQPRRSWRALGEEWGVIVAAIALSEMVSHPALYVVAVIVIGARQHALTVLGHDASHYRLLPGRLLNELVGNLLCMWPTFASVAGFRHFHGDHHRYVGRESDANRKLWKTHDAQGRLRPLWVYPKTVLGLGWVIVSRLVFLTGPRWILRGLLSGLVVPERGLLRGLRWASMGAAVAIITLADAWTGVLLYWIVPFCTWHIVVQYVRIICEHSAVRSSSPAYRVTRTTIPGWLGRVLVLPRNIGYHLEHHWYPSVPFHALPLLHACLMQQPGFSRHANVQRSILGSLRECTGR